MTRKFVGTVLVGVFIFGLMFGERGVRVHAPCGRDCALALSANVPMFLAALSVLGLVLFTPIRCGKPLTGYPVRIWRRFWAFIIDAYLAASIFGTIAVMSSLFLLYQNTGNWVWQVELVPSPLANGLSMISGVLFMGGIIFYFWRANQNGKTSLGKWLMGYKVVPRDGMEPRPLFGLLASLVAWSTWFFWIGGLDKRDSETGDYWWDRMGQTKAVYIGNVP